MTDIKQKARKIMDVQKGLLHPWSRVLIEELVSEYEITKEKKWWIQQIQKHRKACQKVLDNNTNVR